LNKKGMGAWEKRGCDQKGKRVKKKELNVKNRYGG